jgi:hypothetical protein
VVLPLLLAGPIVRRVEPRLVSIWVASSEEAVVTVEVWPGVVDAGGDAGPFTLPGAVATGSRPTVRVAEHLHIAVVTAVPTGNQPLLPGTRYSYNVSLAGGPGGARDLRTLGLLADRVIQPALGYQPGLLPSFATCPVAIEDLVLLHASCNRVHDPAGPNLFYAVDELIEQDHADPRRRPHQLFLTGDQTYSDDVHVSLGVLMNTLARELLGVPELLELPEPDGSGVHRVPVHHQNFPPGYRLALMDDVAKLTSSEAHTHALGVGERCALHLLHWSPEVWEADGDGRAFLADPEVLLRQEAPPLLDALESPPPGMTAAQAGAASVYLARHLSTYTPKALRKARVAAVEERRFVAAYFAKVGRVRRALANVPTYMMCDDHDVTDDWYLCRQWKTQVLGNPLGRSVVRDGLVAYLLMQGWGNDPAAFATGPGQQLLAAVEDLFPPGVPAGPDPAATVALDALLGTDGGTPAVRWNYSVDGSTHRVLVCDTRTRRGFTGPLSPPQQLPDGELQVQIPEGPLPAGLEVLLVVLPQPALDPLLLGELTQGIVSRGVEAWEHIKARFKRDRPQARATAGLALLDYEGWGARPAELPPLFDRLATYPRVLILSGDVHFAVSLRLSYWRRPDGLVSQMGQLTCSALAYITFPEVTVPLTGFGWLSELAGRGYPVQILGWRDPPADPVATAELPARGLRRRLLSRPVLLPTGGWPADTTVRIEPDFAWEFELLRDARPGAERPESTHAPALRADFDAAAPLDGPDGYAALAARHSATVRTHHHTRRLLLQNKVGRLTFVRDDDHLTARNDLLSVPHRKPSAEPAESFTRHEVRFDAVRETPLPAIGG